MAIVGEAYVVVRAITSSVEGDIKKMFNETGKFNKIGEDAGAKFLSGLKNAATKNSGFGTAFAGDFEKLGAKAEAARQKFNALVISSNFVGTGLTMLGTSVVSLGSGLVSLGSTLVAAAPAAVALGGAFVSAGLGAATAMLAFAGVGQAVQKIIQQQQGLGGASAAVSAQRAVDDARRALAMNAQTYSKNPAALGDAWVASDKAMAAAARGTAQAQYDLNKALREGTNQLQAIKFAAEDAALGEKRAALNLENARLNLQRVQDLPPNSKARREAELAYQEADLALRKSIDANQQAQAEKTRIVKTGTDADKENLDSVRAARLAADDAARASAEAVYQRNLLERDSIQKTEQATLALTRAIEDQKRSAATNNPFIGLTDAQKQFAEFLASLHGVTQSLKEAAAANFFPKLEQAINTLLKSDLLGVVKNGIGEIGSALGDASIKIAKDLVAPQTVKDIKTIFDDAAYSISQFGDAFGSVLQSIAAILATASPQIRGFADYVKQAAADFKNFIDTKRASGELAAFFAQAQAIASQWGTIFHNLFGGLFGIIKANTGPGSGGQILLDWLQKITAQFNTFANSVGGQKALRDIFAGAATNAIALLNTVGKFANVLFKASADPGIKQFWDTIGKAVPSFEKIVQQFGNAGPALGELIVSLAKMFELLTQGGAITTMFDGLKIAVDAVNMVLSNPIVMQFINALAVMHGALLAASIVFRALDFIFLSWIGHLGKIFTIISGAPEKFALLKTQGKAAFEVVSNAASKVVDFTKDAVSATKEFATTVGTKVLDATKAAASATLEFGKNLAQQAAVGVRLLIDGMKEMAQKAITMLIAGFNSLKATMLANPLFLIAAIIAGIVIALVELYKHNEMVRNAIDAAWKWIHNAILTVWNWIKSNWPLLLGILTGPIGLAVVEIVKHWDGIVAFVKGIPAKLAAVASNMWDWLTNGLSTIWNNAVNFFTNTVGGFIKGLGGKIAGWAGGIWDGLKSGLVTVLNFIVTNINKAIGVINKGIDGLNIINPFKDIPHVPTIPPVNFATGGVVMPRPGGVLARVAEAGSPERIEPLDKDGLSKRDKALIAFLSGGSGNTFNINPAPGMNEVELAHLISRQIAFQTRKGGV